MEAWWWSRCEREILARTTFARVDGRMGVKNVGPRCVAVFGVLHVARLCENTNDINRILCETNNVIKPPGVVDL